jgi:molecular chaperone HscB
MASIMRLARAVTPRVRVSITATRLHNHIACWDCGKCEGTEGDSVFFWCDCGAIQPLPPDTSYFEIFGFEPSIDIDRIELDKRFRDAQRLLHPDKYANSSKHEKDLSAANSSVVNVAYQTLRSPLLRTKYLLQKHDITVFDDKANTSRYVDPMFLMEMVELRERVESSKSKPELESIKKLNKASIKKTIKELSKHFQILNKEAISTEAVRLQFFTKVEEEVDEAMMSLIK